jgi:hypothetical protein
MHSARAAEFPHNHCEVEERAMNAKMNPSAVPYRGSVTVPDTKSLDAAKGAHDAAKRAHDAAQVLLNAAKGAHDAAQAALNAAKGAHDAAKRALDAAKAKVKGAHD